jgi:hypothetical protein
MTIQQLEQRLIDLERQVTELQREVRPLRALAEVNDTFGLFAGDPEFEKVVQFGREFRNQENAKDDEC